MKQTNDYDMLRELSQNTEEKVLQEYRQLTIQYDVPKQYQDRMIMELCFDGLTMNIKRMLACHSKKGIFLTKDELIGLQKQQEIAQKQKIENQDDKTILQTTEDRISGENLCLLDKKSLVSVQINQLEVGKPTKDCILWVKSIHKPVKVVGVNIVVEDQNKQAVLLTLYNQFDNKLKQQQIEQIFPVGNSIGICNPYLKVSYSGTLSLRNDNPQNIKFNQHNVQQNQSEQQIDYVKDVQSIKNTGNYFFQNGNYLQAIEKYNQALECKCDNQIKLVLYSNIAQCYLNLELPEESLEFCEQALQIDDNHQKTLIRQARSYIFIQQFEKAYNIFQKFGFIEEALKCIKYQKQLQGYFDQKELKIDDHCQHFVADLEIRKVEGMGRGLFAKSDYKKSQILIVEKPIAVVMYDKNETIHSFDLSLYLNDAASLEMTQKLYQLISKGGIEAIRISQFYDGSQDLDTPDINIFRYGFYKKYSIKNLNIEQLKQIQGFNCFDYAREKKRILRGLVSFINHSKTKKNIKMCIENEKTCLTFVYACEDIKKGDQIFFDYIEDENDTEVRKNMLKQWGIVENE